MHHVIRRLVKRGLFFGLCFSLLALMIQSTSFLKYIRFQSIRKVTVNMVCEYYCPDPSRPIPKSLKLKNLSSLSLPPLAYPPVIFHIKTDKKWTNVVDMIAFETGMTISYIKELFSFGAIYCTSSLCVQDQSNADDTSSNKNDKKIQLKVKESHSKISLSTTRVNLIRDKFINIPINSYFRIHANPRR